MVKLYVDSDKFGDANASPTVDAFHAAVKEIVRTKLAASGGHWDSFVFDKSYALITAEDMAGVEKMMLDAGHLFDWSAAISPQERPDVYKPIEGVSDADMAKFSFEHEDAVTGPDGNLEQRGQGDNVARYPTDCEGIARYVRSPMQVMKFLEEGVPDNTIAIIDDSGGTLTAPILDQFKGVICAGGSTRSHLGILTREYGVPCLMNAKISGIRQGDTVRFECTADPKTAADYQKNVDRTAKVWRVASAD
ncbi:PEP-utilizing enzyme [Chachezhania sediminis]|uniref:PEP-utilizing enzyme n=1 Tax=Chachezhania sediminis TaxID=2599291 RepID=UPI00131B33F4|nr:PEP-utilizing enzyme [Chachezhania sediminis]